MAPPLRHTCSCSVGCCCSLLRSGTWECGSFLQHLSKTWSTTSEVSWAHSGVGSVPTVQCVLCPPRPKYGHSINSWNEYLLASAPSPQGHNPHPIRNQRFPLFWKSPEGSQGSQSQANPEQPLVWTHLTSSGVVNGVCSTPGGGGGGGKLHAWLVESISMI